MIDQPTVRFKYKMSIIIIIMADPKQVKIVENKIRDLINWIEVWNLEEIEDNTKKIADETVVELKEKLQEIAEDIGEL